MTAPMTRSYGPIDSIEDAVAKSLAFYDEVVDRNMDQFAAMLRKEGAGKEDMEALVADWRSEHISPNRSEFEAQLRNELKEFDVPAFAADGKPCAKRVRVV